MKKFKFEKPFAAYTHRFAMLSFKEKWRIALHDPAYLIIIFVTLLILIFRISIII